MKIRQYEGRCDRAPYGYLLELYTGKFIMRIPEFDTPLMFLIQYGLQYVGLIILKEIKVVPLLL